MDRDRNFGDADGMASDEQGSNKIPFVDVISVQTIVKVLIDKGICTYDELFEEEKRYQEFKASVKDLPVVQTDQDTQRRSRSHDKDNGYRTRNMSWLKRKLSKRRWTRRLGTKLFGWKWKKNKREEKHAHADPH